MMRPPPAAPRDRRGVIMWLAMALMVLVTILAWMLAYLSRYEEVSAVQVYRSEALTGLCEAVLEELVVKINEQLNKPAAENKIYHDVRQASAKDIIIDAAYLRRLCASSRKMVTKEFGIPDKEIAVRGRISHVLPFDIKGFKDPTVRDPIEKNAQLDLEVGIRWDDGSHPVQKVISLSRPFKVVRCTMPVLAETTLFVNNTECNTFSSKRENNFAVFPSVFGYVPGKTDPQPSLVLDNGWFAYAKYNKKTDFIRHLEDSVVDKGKVPPGRVFINKGIVPLTNGDRVSGMLQKAFNSGESELLPAQTELDLKALKEHLARQGMQTRLDALPSPSPAAAPSPRASPGASPRASPAPQPSPNPAADAVPGHGQLFIRWVGHGEELKHQAVTVAGKKVDAYGIYFESLVKAVWGLGVLDVGMSGLDLFGRVTEKEKGSAFAGEGFFGKLMGFIRSVTADILSKLFAKYNIRISPTFVYGDVVCTYLGLVDYVETDWWNKIRNTFSFNPNQFPLPWFPERFLDRFDANAPIARKEQLPAEWDEKVRERWLKLPEDMRKPRFYKIIYDTFLKQPSYLLPGDMRKQIPQGVYYAPYNEAIFNYLPTKPDSKLRQYFNLMSQRGAWFLKNEFDRDLQSKAGPFWRQFSLGLHEFNPFLFYVKATDYISAIFDPRNPKESVFFKKFYNRKDEVFDFNGVIYITGTEDLVLGRARYRGKGIIITFGRVIFKDFFTKHPNHNKPDKPEENANLTIISLGGLVFDTSAEVDAQLYSFIYPPQAWNGHRPFIFGTLGANTIDLTLMPNGADVVFDGTYHIPPDLRAKDKDHYYHVAITNEISKFGYWVQRDTGLFDERERPQ